MRCARCGRSSVPLIVTWVSGGYRWSWDDRVHVRLEGYGRREHGSLATYGARCLYGAECAAIVESKAAKAKLRASTPEDAVLRDLFSRKTGSCQWCGETVWWVNKAGQVKPHYSRMWHDGRVVHPGAVDGLEPNCLHEFQMQPKTFRGQVWARDRGVCAICGRDIPALLKLWEQLAEEVEAPFRARKDAHWQQRPVEYGDRDAWRERGDAYRRIEAERHAAMVEFREANPKPEWHADHVVPLEDGGEHTMANAQTACRPCHMRKTGEENAARARRRTADQRDRGV